MKDFKGDDYDPKLDYARLNTQNEKIFHVMKEMKWLTLSEINALTDAPEASISAHLRCLRRPSFGSYVIERRRRGDQKSGLCEYRLQPPGTISKWDVAKRRNKLREALEMVWAHPDTTQNIKDEIMKIMKGKKQ